MLVEDGVGNGAQYARAGQWAVCVCVCECDAHRHEQTMGRGDGRRTR